jgi:hypothetical protein
VEIHFDEALAGTITVVLYAEFDNVIEIEILLLVLEWYCKSNEGNACS